MCTTNMYNTLVVLIVNPIQTQKIMSVCTYTGLAQLGREGRFLFEHSGVP